MKLSLPEADKHTLERWIKSRAIGIKQKQRAQMILMTASGQPTSEIMATLQVSNPTLNLWRTRYVEAGLDGLIKGKTRAPGIPRLSTAKIQEILTLTLTGKPVAATHWSCRTLAKQVGVSRMSVNRIWQEHKLKPHRAKGFKVSTDPLFAEKLRDVMGPPLYSPH